MPPPKSKYAKKRKAGLDEDTSAQGSRARAAKAVKARKDGGSSADEDRPPSPDRKKQKSHDSNAAGGSEKYDHSIITSI